MNRSAAFFSTALTPGAQQVRLPGRWNPARMPSLLRAPANLAASFAFARLEAIVFAISLALADVLGCARRSYAHASVR